MSHQFKKISAEDKALISSILHKIDMCAKQYQPIAQLSFHELFQLLNEKEKKIAKEILHLNPKKYGFRGPRYGITPVPRSIVILRNQRYIRNKKTIVIVPQLIPRRTHLAYQKLAIAIKQDIGKTLLVESGYRSPAYQLIVFLRYFRYHKWDMKKTCGRVALPGYSEHGYPKKQALDFITVKGIPSDTNPFAFEKTKEYLWLCKHAYKFHFFLSYPKKNKWGVMFEPWHWSFRK